MYIYIYVYILVNTPYIKTYFVYIIYQISNIEYIYIHIYIYVIIYKSYIVYYIYIVYIDRYIKFLCKIL